MQLVRRIYVEKKSGFDIEAKAVLADLRENLGLLNLTNLRVLCRYDTQNISDDNFERAKTTIFSEPNADDIYEGDFHLSDDEVAFGVEPLPGQFDQRADSAAQCVSLLGGERPLVVSSKVYVLSGNLTQDDIISIKKYVINPIESREASFDLPETLVQNYEIPTTVATLDGLTTWDDTQLSEFYSSMGFAMTLSDLSFCRDYFRDDERRDPTVTELRVIDTYWSDHCRHTTFLTQLDEIEIADKTIKSALENYFAAREELYGERINKKPVCLMDMATVGAKLLRARGLVPDLDLSDEINACSIEVPVNING